MFAVLTEWNEARFWPNCKSMDFAASQYVHKFVQGPSILEGIVGLFWIVLHSACSARSLKPSKALYKSLGRFNHSTPCMVVECE